MSDTTTLAKPRNRRPSWVRRHSPPYWLSLVGGGWMLAFFLIPLVSGLIVSLETGNPLTGYHLTWNWSIYKQLFVHSDIPYTTFFLRSLYYGAATTVLVDSHLVPHGVLHRVQSEGSLEESSALSRLLSFFVSFVIRTDMWSFILSNQGIVITALRKLHLVGKNFHILGTSNAVIGGDVYNNLAFMVLPIYVALERIDGRILEAARDLYANGRQVFLKVVLPLSRAGIFAGVLLVFITTVGDPVVSSLLGGVGHVHHRTSHSRLVSDQPAVQRGGSPLDGVDGGARHHHVHLRQSVRHPEH